MAIRSSSAREVDTLVAKLASDNPVVRETAVARLTVIGARAVIHLAELAQRSNAPVSTRVAALLALETIGDERAIQVASRALGDADARVGVAAASLLQRFLTGERGTGVADALTVRALDVGTPDAVRVAALVALDRLGPTALEPLWNALTDDPSSSVRAHVADAQKGRRAEIASGETGLSADDPEGLARALSTGGRATSVVELQQLIERLRAREEAESGAQQIAWRRARGAAHVALARHGSRVALYDLRESLERSAAPLPVEFMTALSLVGDATCLEAIAAAYAHADVGEKWWRGHLADAFHAIMSREKLTARHAVIKRVQKRWPRILSTTSRT